MNTTFFNGYYLGMMKSARFLTEEELKRRADEIKTKPLDQTSVGEALKKFYRGKPLFPDEAKEKPNVAFEEE